MSALQATNGDVHVWWSHGPRSATGQVLRAVLSEHLHLPPDRVPLERDPSGRPVVGGSSGLEVSVSHTADLVLAAVAIGYRVGVDVELVRDGPWRLLPRHALTANELAVLEECPPAERIEAFLRYWTRKEALLKAAGIGLAIDPHTVEVSSPRDTARVVSLPDALGLPGSWSLVDLEIKGYVAALAAAGASPRVLLRELAAEKTASSWPSASPLDA